jgi:hypothetical protein
MSDNLANNWGCVLGLISAKQSRDKEGDDSGDGGWSILKDVVRGTFNGRFELTKVATCGSDANLFAVVDATGGHLGQCMIAAGSYVSGVLGGLHGWSTSGFATQKGPSVILEPEDVKSDFTKEHTIGLPYYISGVYEDAKIEAYENECMFELHIRCNVAKCNNRPIRTLLMELILAGCGAGLSDRALERLAALAEHHKFNIVLDEIMTGGRTGTMLMVEQTPQCFQNVVAYVTMGKWMGRGLVLASRQEVDRLKGIAKEDDVPARGASMLEKCSQIKHFWSTIRGQYKQAAARRAQVLKKLKVDATVAWGKGVMIYVPMKRMDSAGGLKNRLLPMLADVPIDSLKKNNMMTQWSKKAICKTVMKGTRAWIAAQPEVYSILTDHTYRLLCTVLASGLQGNEGLHIPWSALFPEKTCRAMQNACFNSAVEHELVNATRVGTKRTRAGSPKRGSLLPWLKTGVSLHPEMTLSGADYVGAQVHDKKKDRFGKVSEYMAAEAIKPTDSESWIILYDDAPLLKVTVKLLDELKELTNDFFFVATTHQDSKRRRGGKC